jgi:hypothetical protein
MHLLKLTFVALLFGSAIAQAGTINLSNVAPSSIGSGTAPNTFYKNEKPNEEGDYKHLFSTVFNPSGSNATTATITYSGSAPVLITEAWVKGGNGLIYFTGFSWDGVGSLILSNQYLPPMGRNSTMPPGISHVAIRGTFPPPTSVPDGAATAGLLGAALGGLAFFARRRQA